MNINKTSRHLRFGSGKRSGFSLVATVLLLPLICILCISLLSLSTISLRKSERESHAQTAQANARLALTMAVAQLQQAAGPDQRITAPANLLIEKAHPGITGVWESYKLDPEGSPSLPQNKQSSQGDPEANGEFITWLGSGSTNRQVSAGELPTPSENAVTLLSSQNHSLRENPVILPDGSRIAWATLDEGVKARLNLSRHAENSNDTSPEKLASARLRAPEANHPQILDGLQSLPANEVARNATISFAQAGHTLAEPSKLDLYRDDLTTWSEGLLTNVVDGGLKADLSRLFESSSLPSDLKERHLYSWTDTPLTPADPLVSNLADWYRLYRNSPPGDLKPQPMTIPAGYSPSIKKYNPSTRTVVSPPRMEPLKSQLLAPVVTRVQVVFSMVVREPHAPWNFESYDPEMKYMAYLIYSPAVTVYNPYSVPLTFQGLEVSFSHLPLAFQFYRNGSPQTSQPALLSQLHGLYENQSDWEDKFTARLSTSPGGSVDAPITLSPGEAKIFGLSHPPGTTWPNMLNFIYASGQKSLTEDQLKPGPGWDYRCGFIVDVLRPNIAGRINHIVPDYVLPLRGGDELDVACSLLLPSNGKVQDFNVSISAKVNNTATELGVFSYQYGTREELEKALAGEPHPELGPIAFPFRRERPWRVPEVYEPRSDSTPYESWVGPKPFAIFSLAARTAEGSLFPTKPVRQSSFNHQVLEMDVGRLHPAQMPVEASFLPIRTGGGGTVGSIEIANDGTDRVYHFSGNTRLNGVLNFPTFEIPSSAPVNLTEFRNANLASSGHLPLVTYTVGESTAHPTLPPDKAILRNSDFGYDLTDHSWLANHSLWDRFYLSTIRNKDDAKTLIAGKKLELNPRLARAPGQRRRSQEIEESLLSDEGWTSAAAFQSVTGAFNVNSTSVNAWKAVLASLKDVKVPVFDPDQNSHGLAESSEIPFPRLIHSTGNAINGSEGSTTAWKGFRELTEDQIDSLAQAIVRQVKERGPFLSMSEFVNRKLAPAGDPASLAGSLEAAIRDSSVNDAVKNHATRTVSLDEAERFGYQYPAAATGDVEEGAIAYLSQGDLLSAIGSFITVRSDTFLIRSYGESRNKSGKIESTAFIEAVVQRTPEFIDRTEVPEKAQAALGDPSRLVDALSETNRKFGRRFSVISFRWLNASEPGS